MPKKPKITATEDREEKMLDLAMKVFDSIKGLSASSQNQFISALKSYITEHRDAEIERLSGLNAENLKGIEELKQLSKEL